MVIVALFIAGGFGTISRYVVSEWASRVLGDTLPYGTIATNLLGSFLVGLIMPLALGATAISDEMRLMVTVGFLGGFTTYSGFNYETIDLMSRGDYGKGALYASLMFGACMVAGALGLLIAKRIST